MLFRSTVGTIPLVCTPTINNTAVSKMLIDGGAGLNAEAYVDDIVVKTREEDTLIKDLEETFANLR